jgi:5-formyltetrahydrofolate cyclo-ligase
MDDKQTFRLTMRARRDALTPEFRAEHDRLLYDKLSKHPLFLTAKVIHTFISFGSEISTHAIIEQAWALGKIVVTSRIAAPGVLVHHAIESWDQLVPGTWGILTPLADLNLYGDLAAIDLILVPGLAFDREGYRVGYGGGFYDGFLPKTRGVKMGLAFDIQFVPEVPHLFYDVRLDRLLTPTREYIFTEESAG